MHATFSLKAFLNNVFKVEKVKDGATIKSKKNAEGRKVSLTVVLPFSVVKSSMTVGSTSMQPTFKKLSLLFSSNLFQVWICEVVTPVPASKLWEKLQVSMISVY